jgi:hypothetical protein
LVEAEQLSRLALEGPQEMWPVRSRSLIEALHFS